MKQYLLNPDSETRAQAFWRYLRYVGYLLFFASLSAALAFGAAAGEMMIEVLR